MGQNGLEDYRDICSLTSLDKASLIGSNETRQNRAEPRSQYARKKLNVTIAERDWAPTGDLGQITVSFQNQSKQSLRP